MKKTLLILMAVAVVAVGCEGRQSYSAGSSKPSASNTSTPTELRNKDTLKINVTGDGQAGEVLFAPLRPITLQTLQLPMEVKVK